MREGVKSKQIIIANNKVFIVAMVNKFQRRKKNLNQKKKLRSVKVYKVKLNIGSIIRSKEIRGKS